MFRPTPPSHPVELARWAVDHAQGSPEEALSVAQDLIGSDSDPEASAVAHWAAGLACRELGNLTDSRSHLENAALLAADYGHSRLRSEIASSLALTLAYLGLTDEALRIADAARHHLTGAAAARNEMQRSLILQRLGRFEEALEGYGRALPGLRRADDRIAEARLLTNRGLLHGYTGRHDEGIADLQEARLIAGSLGQQMMQAALAHNLGFLELRRGDLPAAFSWFDEAEGAYAKVGSPRGHLASLEADRAGAFLLAGLVPEARDGYDRAIHEAERESNVFDLAESKLAAARAALVAGDAGAGAYLAGEAETAFRHQRRTAWAQLAALTRIQARLADDVVNELSARKLSREAAALGGRLGRAGLAQEADEARLSAGEFALKAGETARARRILSPLTSRAQGPAIQRARSHYASALVHKASGDPGAAARAVQSGLEILHEHQASLGATELRARSASHAFSLVNLGVELALESDDPLQALVAVESWRSISWMLPSIRPPRDASFGSVLAELREVNDKLARAADVGDARAELIRRQAELEATAGRIVRRRRGGGSSWRLLDIAEIRRTLGGRSLVAYFNRRGSVCAVVVDDSGIRLVEGPPVDRVSDDVAGLVFSLHRLAGGRGSPDSLAAAESALHHSASALSDELILPLALPGEELVVIPTGVLHRLPWGALPALAGRAVSIAPSVGAWIRARKSFRSVDLDSRAVIVAGPGLAGALAEAEDVSRRYANGVVLTGEQATVERVRTAVGSSQVAHIAAHGSFRNDNPAFSSLRLCDGPLMVHDLDEIRTPPVVVVMPSCDAGINRVMVGDEVLGLSAALLRLGVKSLIAPLLPVPDASTRPLMAALHDGLIGGLLPAQALAEAVRSMSAETPEERATKASFVSFGA